MKLRRMLEFSIKYTSKLFLERGLYQTACRQPVRSPSADALARALRSNGTCPLPLRPAQRVETCGSAAEVCLLCFLKSCQKILCDSLFLAFSVLYSGNFCLSSHFSAVHNVHCACDVGCGQEWTVTVCVSGLVTLHVEGWRGVCLPRGELDTCFDRTIKAPHNSNVLSKQRTAGEEFGPGCLKGSPQVEKRVWWFT